MGNSLMKKKNRKGNFNGLPTDILLEIITRLPTETVLNCKLVCRLWRNLVSFHPSFSRLHLARINQSSDSGKLSFLALDWEQKLLYFEYNQNVDCIRRFNLTSPFPYYKVIGSINGLVCLYECYDNAACICNPMTKEYVVLPEIKRYYDDKYELWSSGFGYDSLTNEYKVVALYKLRVESSRFIDVVVYTLGSGNGWRNVGRLDTKFAQLSGFLGVFVNGSLHWGDELGGRILVFDLTKEKFTEHLSPPYLRPVSSIWTNFIIGEMGGVLYYAIITYCRITDCTSFNVWLLKKKNDVNDKKDQVQNKPLGWSKQCNIPGSVPLAFTKSGSVLCFDFKSLRIYDAIASTSEELVDFGGGSQIFPHRNTLVSLKELGGGDIKIMEPAENEDD